MVTVNCHADPPGPVPRPVLYPGFILPHGILHQTAAVTVPRHAILRNRSVSEMCHLPVPKRGLQQTMSTHLRHVHQCVIVIFSIPERLERQHPLVFPLRVLLLVLHCWRHRLVMLRWLLRPGCLAADVHLLRLPPSVVPVLQCTTVDPVLEPT